MPDELKPVYLLCGSDRPKIARALERLRGRFAPDAVEVLLANETSGEALVAACNALGLFADRGRLLVVEQAEAWKAADTKALAAYMVTPAPATVVALVAAELKIDSALARTCAKGGEVLAYDVAKGKLPHWVVEHFDRLGIKVSRDVAEVLVELAGENLDELSSEIHKLATWAGDDPLTEADVQALVAARPGTSSFALTDAWGKRDIAGVLRAAEGQLEQASDARRELTRMAGTLGSHVSRVRACQALEEQGIAPRDAATRLKRHRFYVERLYSQARNFGVEELRGAVVRLAALDRALKGGSRLAGELELERALVELTGDRPVAAGPREGSR